MLANALSQAGHDVLCLKGVGATSPLRFHGPRMIPFTTNADLQEKLVAISDRNQVGAFFHTAALCDFKASEVLREDGKTLDAAAKISSREGRLTILLEPLPKLITELRALFPSAKIVGWKYELDGNRDQVLAAAHRQMREANSDACVANGAAWGAGFGLCEGKAPPIIFPDKRNLCSGLVTWLAKG